MNGAAYILKNMKEKIYNFFEHPNSKTAYAFQAIIVVAIFISVGIVVVEVFYHTIFTKYHDLILNINHAVLALFTVEYVLRLATAPAKFAFVRKPMNVVDFLAIAPNYLEFVIHMFIDTTELRILRIIRLLRFMRMLRILKLFKYSSLLKKIFQFQNTILESIFPILVIFLLLKSTIWVLEYYHFWISNADLGNLFAIIGFALGIILSQKIGVSYDKFIQVEEASIRLYGTLRSLSLILDAKKKKIGTIAAKEWAHAFLVLLENAKADNFTIQKANTQLYKSILQIENTPSELAILHGDICRDAAFCLSKKVRLTPKAYDTLLHQATMLYLALITVFIPGITGVISVVTATYILYGMYHLTQDLDTITGGEFNLINIDLSELHYIAEEK